MEAVREITPAMMEIGKQSLLSNHHRAVMKRAARRGTVTMIIGNCSNISSLGRCPRLHPNSVTLKTNPGR
jgi:hypothetical protein